jgi:hypothetical protein
LPSGLVSSGRKEKDRGVRRQFKHSHRFLERCERKLDQRERSLRRSIIGMIPS